MLIKMHRLNWKWMALPSMWLILRKKDNKRLTAKCQLMQHHYQRFLKSSFNHFTINAKESSDTQIILTADDLYNKSETGITLYEYLKPYENSNNADILWRLARAARDKALKDNTISKDDKKSLIYEAFECSKRALEADENNFGSHKWFAITIGDVGDYEGTKAKIANAFLIRDHLERAIKLNPKDATSYHCLGMWCFVFADMPWYQHKMAAILFTTPPSSTYKEAAEIFQKAENVDPNFYSVNLLMLGKSYARMDDYRHAMLYLDKASKYPVKNKEDKDAVEEAKKLLEEVISRHKK